jgi:uncharacterized protein (DUF1800 family)
VCTQWAETGRLAETWQTMNVGLADAGCWLLVAGCCYCSPAQVHFTSESSVTGFPEAVRDSSAPSGKTWPTKNEDRDSTELPTPPPDLPTHPTHTQHTHAYAPARSTHTQTRQWTTAVTQKNPPRMNSCISMDQQEPPCPASRHLKDQPSLSCYI